MDKSTTQHIEKINMFCKNAYGERASEHTVVPPLIFFVCTVYIYSVSKKSPYITCSPF